MHTHVKELIEAKSSTVHSVNAGTTVRDAAELMNKHHIGAVVVQAHDDMVGILSERDILTRVVAADKDPASTDVADVMTSEVLTCTPETGISEARRVMRTEHIRHLPVIDDGKIAGMVSIGDLNLVENETLTETIRYMEAYIGGGQLR